MKPLAVKCLHYLHGAMYHSFLIQDRANSNEEGDPSPRLIHDVRTNAVAMRFRCHPLGWWLDKTVDGLEWLEAAARVCRETDRDPPGWGIWGEGGACKVYWDF